MKKVLVVLFCAVQFGSIVSAQTTVASEWDWIIPLRTSKREVEARFGRSITKVKTDPFQTYKIKSGKVTITYAGRNEYVEECSCNISPGTVLEVFVSSRYRFLLSDLRYDTSKFEVNRDYAPREISYFSKELGVLITTEAVRLTDGREVEYVIAIERRPSFTEIKPNSRPVKPGRKVENEL